MWKMLIFVQKSGGETLCVFALSHPILSQCCPWKTNWAQSTRVLWWQRRGVTFPTASGSGYYWPRSHSSVWVSGNWWKVLITRSAVESRGAHALTVTLLIYFSGTSATHTLPFWQTAPDSYFRGISACTVCKDPTGCFQTMFVTIEVTDKLVDS